MANPTATVKPDGAADVLIGTGHVIKDIEFGASLTITTNSLVEWVTDEWLDYASDAGATAYAVILKAVATGAGETQKVPAVLSGQVSTSNVNDIPDDTQVLGLLVVGA